MSARTTYLGQFSDARADAIAAALEQAGITWWYKRSGALAQVLFAGDWGVRLFVDAARLDEARALADATPEPPVEPT